MLATGRATMDEIVAVTFTEKAAGELKLRLREASRSSARRRRELETRDTARGRARTLEEAHVNTIHGFCAELLRERPVEAGVDPLFTVLTEPQAERLYARAFRAWLQEALSNPPEGVRRALRRTSGSAVRRAGRLPGPIERLRGAGWTLAGHPRLPASVAAPVRSIATAHDRAASARRCISSPTLSRAGIVARQPVSSLDRVRRDSQQIRLEQSFDQRDLDAWEARLVDLVARSGSRQDTQGVRRTSTERSRAPTCSPPRDALLRASVLQFRADADGDLAALLQEELRAADRASIRRSSAARARSTSPTCSTCTRDLLRDEPGRAPASAAAVRQDLRRRVPGHGSGAGGDPAPARAADDAAIDAGWTCGPPRPGKLFIVGDPKQAIYRFRGADVGTYWAVREHLEQRGGRVLQLTTNFRSVPAIQRFVNRAFEQEMAGGRQALQAAYVPLVGAAAGRPLAAGARRAAGAGAVLERPHVRRRGDGQGRRRIAARRGRRVHRLAGRRERMAGGGAAGRRDRAPGPRSQPRHIAVLFRRFTSFAEDMTRPYIDALDARGVPHLLVGGKAFHDREEVETIRAALAAIEWPDDELSVFATLKGSLFAIDDEHLLEYRHRFGAFHPFRVARGARRQFRQRARADGRADRASAADRRRAAAAPESAPAPQLPSRGGHHRAAAGCDACARRLHAAARRRAGARQRAPRRRARAPVRGRWRHLVPRLHRPAAPGGRGDERGRGADRRGGQRRRAADDRPQGQGPRVSRSSCSPTSPAASVATTRAAIWMRLAGSVP